MHRFFISPNGLHGDQVLFEDATAHQIRNVLRMKSGAHLIVLDNAGWEYEVELTEVEKPSVRGTIHEKRAAEGEPTAAITLYQCLLKKDNFEWVLQKCTEIGVSRFVPVISQRTVITQVKANKLDRWERIITEAAEQSRRGRIPELAEPLDFAAALDDLHTDCALIPWEEATETTLRAALAAHPTAQSVALFIGPEGGFDPAEVAQAAEADVQPITLGSRILRAETAAVVASALVLHEVEL